MPASSYLSLLRLPAVPLAFSVTALARVHYGGISLALLLAVRDRSGSFAAAGLTVGLFAAASVSMPFKARLVDRRGQRRILPPLDVGYGAALCSTALLPVGTVAAAAFVAGLLAPPVGPSMRSRWSHVTTDALRERAFALDTAAEEAFYVAAPALAGLLAAWSSTGGLLVSAMLAVVGVVGLGLAPGAPPVRAAPTTSIHRLPPGLWPGLLVAVGFGAGTATLEFAVTVRLTARGDGAVTGLLLGAVAVGSVVGGLAWGRRTHKRTVAVHLAALLGWLVLGTAAVALVDATAPLGVLLAVVGLAVSPVLVVLYVAVVARTARARRTEATTWVTTAVNLGSAAGAAAGGAVVAATGASWLAAAAALPLLAATVGAPWVAGGAASACPANVAL